MRTSKALACLSGVAGCLLMLGPSLACSQTIINLTQDATVRTSATYTYYARGDNTVDSSNPTGTTPLSPFSVAFYPQNVKDNSLTWNKSYSSSDAGAIALTSGWLTDNKTDHSMAGYQYVNQFVTAGSGQHAGSYDILFDLGGLYTITSVTVTYTDASGARWTTTANAQSVYYSATVPTSDASLSLFATSTATVNTTLGSMAFTPSSAVDARYLDIRPMVQVSDSSTYPTASSIGGYITEVTINGYAAVQEPSTAALVGPVVLAVAAVMGFRRRKVLCLQAGCR